MNELIEHSFDTKPGICIITPEKIVIKRTGLRGQVSRQVYGNSIRRALSVYMILGALTIFIGIWNLVNNSYLEGLIFCLIGAFCFGNIVISWNNSAANIIERSTVKKVVAQHPHPPFTRGVFVVNFLENGKMRKRLIGLPGSMSGGEVEFKRALAIMRETGWYNG